LLKEDDDMKRLLLITGLVLALSLVVTGVAWAQGGDEGTGGGEVALLLAPLVAAATAIERIIEMIFDWYESAILNISKFPAQAKDYLSWARKEVERLQEELLNLKSDPAALAQAEEQLAQAQDRLHDYLSSPFYTSWKRTLSLVLGVVLGLIVAFTTGLQMFGLLGIKLQWTWIDMLVTGLVIGTGSAPVHSLIGLLQNTKDAVDQARALWTGKAYSQVLEAELQKVEEVRRLSAMAPPVSYALGEAAAAEEEEREAPPVSDIALNRRIGRILR
jgi:hypothetical protein